ncbi:NAD-dependent protein deacetylase [Tessaracoccus antarcticus]|uniref:protein acetyllysine N-acetyltransferase n=2 Tax=Tessaracoccus antarcticus TaxID=2479848 RepID=A0A3M0GBZ1_9ACTN|nr:NAD-dependent protein deacetylase [Tessaracoccus antarcticus]
MVLTGAGTSTASGLADYRGPGAIPRSPMTYQEFVSSDIARRHYWARSTVGWPSFRVAQPNRVHHLVADLATVLPVTGVVTQNVDGLHQAAGSNPVLDLHGRLATVSCLTCGTVIDREALQATLLELNPEFASRLDYLARQAAGLPDGDAEVDRTEEFIYPDCPVCRGVLKPDVVYFGENADPAVVNASFDMLERSDALLVLGTSLSVMSGLRFVRRAARDSKRVIIVNDGTTRGDDLATHRIHGRLESVLEEFVGSLSNLPHP